MAARRLLIVMLVLLGLSTLAAALVPQRTTQDGTTTTTGETAPAPEETTPAGERLPTVIIDAVPPVAQIPIRAGDQLPLKVTSRKTDLVEIPGLGLVEPVGPAKPALFNLLIEEPASYGVKLVTADRVIARIEVTNAAEEKPKSPAPEEPGPA